jgi:hypothetical protein
MPVMQGPSLPADKIDELFIVRIHLKAADFPTKQLVLFGRVLGVFSIRKLGNSVEHWIAHAANRLRSPVAIVKFRIYARNAWWTRTKGYRFTASV